MKPPLEGREKGMHRKVMVAGKGDTLKTRAIKTFQLKAGRYYLERRGPGANSTRTRA